MGRRVRRAFTYGHSLCWVYQDARLLTANIALAVCVGCQGATSWSCAPASHPNEVFERMSREAGRTLDDCYHAMTFEGGMQEQLAIGMITRGNETDEEDDAMLAGSVSGHHDDEDSDSERANREGSAPSVQSESDTDGQHSEGPSRPEHGGVEPQQPPASRNSSGNEGAGVDMGTSAEDEGDLESQQLTRRSDPPPFTQPYEETGKRAQIRGRSPT